MKDFFAISLMLLLNVIDILTTKASDNCLREHEIKQLKKEEKCATISQGDSKQMQWEQCLKQLAVNLEHSCYGLGISKVIAIKSKSSMWNSVLKRLR